MKFVTLATELPQGGNTDITDFSIMMMIMIESHCLDLYIMVNVCMVYVCM